MGTSFEPPKEAFPKLFSNDIDHGLLGSGETQEHHKMSNLFEQNRNYVLGDRELEVIGDREKLS